MSRRRRRHPFRIAFAVVLVSVLARAWFDGPDLARRQQILDAIRMVESGGAARPPDGDGGAAIGPYQIHREYWQDAVAFEPTLGGTYDDCRKRAYAEQVVDAYMRRYVPEAWEQGDAEVVARTHNGGPLGAQKPSTNGYWQKVAERLR